jgi:hypothetical protein
MDEHERTQVRLILEHITAEVIRVGSDKQKIMHGDHSAKGLLRSGSTVREALRIAEEQASIFVNSAVDKVTVIAQDRDAFAIIRASLIIVMRDLKSHVDQAVTIAARLGSGRSESVSREADRLFAEMEIRVSRELEIHSFTFTKPTKSRLAELGITPRNGSGPNTIMPARTLAKKGGRPPAQFWDDMWAAIAVALYVGSLKPKKQADIERAMADWIEANEYSATASTIRLRARRLWDGIATADE